MKPEGNEIGWRMTVVADGGCWSVTVKEEGEGEGEEGWRVQELKEGAREGGGGWLEGEGG